MNPTVTQNILSTLTTLKMSHHKWRVWHNKHKTVLTPTVAPIMTIYESGCSICLLLPWCCDCYQLTTCQLIFLPMNQSVISICEAPHTLHTPPSRDVWPTLTQTEFLLLCRIFAGHHPAPALYWLTQRGDLLLPWYTQIPHAEEL